MEGKVIAVCVSKNKGEQKKDVSRGLLIKEWGLDGDAHASSWHRQLSLLAKESIDKMRKEGLEVGPGDFAENITTEGVNLFELPLGTRIRIGNALLKVTQIGKECHDRCAVYYQAGDCVMPREGIFTRVIKGGEVNTGDPLVILENEQEHHG